MDSGDDFLTQSREYINTRYIVDNAFRGVMARFARRIDRTPQQVGGMLNDNPTRPIGKSISEHMENCLGLPSGWLSQSHSIEELERGAAVVRKLLAADGGDTRLNRSDLRRTIRPLPEYRIRRKAEPTMVREPSDEYELDEDLPDYEEGEPRVIRAQYRQPTLRDSYRKRMERLRHRLDERDEIERVLRQADNDVDVIRGLAHDAGKNRVIQRLLNRVGGDSWYTVLLYKNGDNTKPTPILVTVSHATVVANRDDGYMLKGREEAPEAAWAAEDARDSLSLRYVHLLIVHQSSTEEPVREAAIVVPDQRTVTEAIRKLTFEGLDGFRPEQFKL